MKAIVRHISPVMLLCLVILWLVLNQTFAAGHLLLGVALGTLVSWATSSLRPLRARLRRLDLAFGLVFVVLYDVLRSSVAVAGIVLGLVRRGQLRSGFIDIPLELRDPHGLAALAAIVTSTPGTVWVGLSHDCARLTLHVLDLRDEREWITLIKHRYERPLRRIFE